MPAAYSFLCSDVMFSFPICTGGNSIHCSIKITSQLSNVPIMLKRLSPNAFWTSLLPAEVGQPACLLLQLYMPRLSNRWFFFSSPVSLAPRNYVATVFVHLLKQPLSFVTVLTLLHYLGRHLPWSQQGTKRLRSAWAPLFVYSHLHPFLNVPFLEPTWCVCNFCGPLEMMFLQAPRMWRELTLLSPFALLPHFMWVRVHACARMCTHCATWVISRTCKQNKKKKTDEERTCVLRIRCENKATRLLYKKLTL